MENPDNIKDNADNTINNDNLPPHTDQVQKTYIVNENTTGRTNNQHSFYQPPIPPISEPVKVSDWILTMIVMSIPCVNIVMFFVYAFSGNKESRKNYFKAQLILLAAWVILSVVSAIVVAIFFKASIPVYKEYFEDFYNRFGY